MKIKPWPDKNTLMHLRFPFSFFLLPVFMFALSAAREIHWANVFLTFFILHFLVFPSSNGYNSFNDRDTGSIGGLKNPPPISSQLFYTTLFMDIIAVTAGLIISPAFSLLVLLFILVSRAYSYRPIRLKKFAFLSFMIVSSFQGGLVFLMSTIAIHDVIPELTPELILGMTISTLFIGSVYPLTQIYQHQSDKNDGIITISYKLGYTGTFIFSAILFLAATVLVYEFYYNLRTPRYFQLFTMVMLPVVIWFVYWFIKVFRSQQQANYRNTMFMNLVTATCMNLFFLFLIVNRYGKWY